MPATTSAPTVRPRRWATRSLSIWPVTRPSKSSTSTRRRPPIEVPVAPYQREGHGGADTRMVDEIFSSPVAAPSALDGARSLLTGLAANESLVTQRSVRVHDLLDLTEWES